MPRLIGWWLIVMVVIVATGTLRYTARSGYAEAVKEPTLVQNIRALLQKQDIKILSEIRKKRTDNQLVGFRFQTKTCEGRMAVAILPITVIAKSFVQKLASQNDAYKFQYQDHEYDNSSRLTLMAIWTKTLLLNGLNLDGPIVSKHQLAIIWPRHCADPALNWSQVWAKPQ